MNSVRIAVLMPTGLNGCLSKILCSLWVLCYCRGGPNYDVLSHLFNTSGSGKTRLALDGLCRHWGFYISCGNHRNATSGSRDFEEATHMLPGMSGWNPDGEICDENALLAHHMFRMLLLARVYVFHHFLGALPLNESTLNARRRWVLLQIMPPYPKGGVDIFTVIFKSLRHSKPEDMKDLTRQMLRECQRNKHFPQGEDTPMYCVVDEAQVAANTLEGMFRTTMRTRLRPILHPLYRFLQDSDLFYGLILAGTGLSSNIVTDVIGAISAKGTTRRHVEPIVFTDTVHFTRDKSDMTQENYVRRYLTLSNKQSERLIERILYWFRGRHVHFSRPLYVTDVNLQSTLDS